MTRHTDINTHNIKTVKVKIHNPEDNTRHAEIKLKGPDGELELAAFGEEVTLEVTE